MQILDLSRNNIGPEGGKHISEGFNSNSALVKLQLSHNFLSASICALPTSLQMLDLSFNELRDKGVVILAPALTLCPALTDLELMGNQISEAAGVLAESLAELKELRYVNLSKNKFGHESAGWAALKALKEKSNHRIRLIMSVAISYDEWDY